MTATTVPMAARAVNARRSSFTAWRRVKRFPGRTDRSAPLGDVLLACLAQDSLALHEVADLDLAACDAGERRRAGVLHEPLRPAHGRRAELPLGAEPALA